MSLSERSICLIDGIRWPSSSLPQPYPPTTNIEHRFVFHLFASIQSVAIKGPLIQLADIYKAFYFAIWVSKGATSDMMDQLADTSGPSQRRWHFSVRLTRQVSCFMSVKGNCQGDAHWDWYVRFVGFILVVPECGLLGHYGGRKGADITILSSICAPKKTIIIFIVLVKATDTGWRLYIVW